MCMIELKTRLSIPYRILTRLLVEYSKCSNDKLSIPYRILTEEYEYQIEPIDSFQFPIGFSRKDRWVMINSPNLGPFNSLSDSHMIRETGGAGRLFSFNSLSDSHNLRVNYFSKLYIYLSIPYRILTASDSTTVNALYVLSIPYRILTK